MRLFITGTAGFIGFHLARPLLAEGHVVHGYDGLTDYAPRPPFREGGWRGSCGGIESIMVSDRDWRRWRD